MSQETILVVDDEANIIALATMYLEKEGYRVERATDGVEALFKLDQLRPALMVLDLMLPEVAQGVTFHLKKSLTVAATYDILMLVSCSKQLTNTAPDSFL